MWDAGERYADAATDRYTPLGKTERGTYGIHVSEDGTVRPVFFKSTGDGGDVRLRAGDSPNSMGGVEGNAVQLTAPGNSQNSAPLSLYVTAQLQNPNGATIDQATDTLRVAWGRFPGRGECDMLVVVTPIDSGGIPKGSLPGIMGMIVEPATTVTSANLSGANSETGRQRANSETSRTGASLC